MKNMIINYKKLSLVFICLFALFLIFSIVTQPLVGFGEFAMYTFTTIALQYEHTLFISERTFENARLYFPDIYSQVMQIYREGDFSWKFPINARGEPVNISYYFPAYSVICMFVSMALKIFGFNQSYAFVLTNFILMIIALLIVYKFLKVSDKAKFFLIMLLSINPIIYYITWQSAEVFVFASIVVSLVFFFNKSYKISALFLTLAGSMNMTAMALGIFMIIIFFIDLQKEKGQGKSFFKTLLDNIPDILKYAASFLFIFLPFIYNYWVTAGKSFLTTVPGMSSTEHLFDRFFAFLFDLNFGLLPWFSFALVLYFVIIIVSILRLEYKYFLLAMGHFCVILSFSLMYHINSGMSGIARYNAWIAPIMFFVIIIYQFEEVKPKKEGPIYFLGNIFGKHPMLKNSIVLFSLVSTTVALFSLGFTMDRHLNYISMGRIAGFVLNRAPSFYNPKFSTFISRIEHRDGGYDFREPVWWFDTRDGRNSEVRKILIRRDEREMIGNYLWFYDERSRLHFESELRRIANRRREFVFINVPPRHRIERSFPPIEFNGVLQFGQGSFAVNYLRDGFHLPEAWHIWTSSERARIRIPINPAQNDLRLTINGHALVQTQTVGIIVNDQIMGEIESFHNEFTIAANDLNNITHLNIEIIVSRLYTPQELGIGDDTRLLGFLLSTIGVHEVLPLPPSSLSYLFY